MNFLASIFTSPSKRTASQDPRSTSRSSDKNGTESSGASDITLENKDKFEFLLELTSGQKQNSKVYQHLFNVYMQLKEENASEELCDAGLFHSIYGPDFKKFQNNKITRDIIRNIIGEYAEHLVHIFCTTRNRFNAIVKNSLKLTNKEIIDLCHIESANFSDLNDRDQYDQKLEALSDTILRLQNEIIVKERQSSVLDASHSTDDHATDSPQV